MPGEWGNYTPPWKILQDENRDLRQALAAAQQAQRAQREAEKWANDANQVSLRYEQQRDEQRRRAEAAEAALVRAREALERIAGLLAPAPNRERMQEIARAALEAMEVTK